MCFLHLFLDFYIKFQKQYYLPINSKHKSINSVVNLFWYPLNFITSSENTQKLSEFY